MQFIVFTKHWRGVEIEKVCEAARTLGVEGFDLTVRNGYPVNPENVRTALPDAAKKARAAGLNVRMITTEGAFLWPDQPDAEPTLAAMDEADVRLVKLGYYRPKPEEGQTYWVMVDKIRTAFDGFQKLAEKHNVKVCYHTHSGPYMGLNASSLMHLLKGFDPKHIGAYMDTAHLFVDGEPFPLALDIVGEHLSIVALKDMAYIRVEQDGRTAIKRTFLPSGKGMVDWDEVFAQLHARGFDGPVSVHCEYTKPTEEEFMAAATEEVAFLRAKAG